MSAWRSAAVAGLICLAVVAQAVLFRPVAVDGIVPNLVLIIVVCAGIARGSQFACILGFAAGLLLDVAPPADHVAGRWALALVIVGYLAGRVRQDARSSPLAAVIVIGAASFIGASVYALSGAIVGDGAMPVDTMLQVIVISVLWDLVLAPFAAPVLLRVLDEDGPVTARRAL